MGLRDKPVLRTPCHLQSVEPTRGVGPVFPLSRPFTEKFTLRLKGS